MINDEATTIQVSAMTSDFECKLRVRVVDDFGNASFPTMPPEMIDELKKQGIDLNDNDERIDLLIGVKHHRKFHDGPEIEVNDDMLGKKTKLGWIVYGGNGDDETVSCVNLVKTYDDEVLQELLKSDVCNHYKVPLPCIEPVDIKSNYDELLHSLMNDAKVTAKVWCIPHSIDVKYEQAPTKMNLIDFLTKSSSVPELLRYTSLWSGLEFPPLTNEPTSVITTTAEPIEVSTPGEKLDEQLYGKPPLVQLMDEVAMITKSDDEQCNNVTL